MRLTEDFRHYEESKRSSGETPIIEKSRENSQHRDARNTAGKKRTTD